MKKIILIIVLLVSLFSTTAVKAEGESLKVYFIPIEQNGNYRGPEYFVWRGDLNGPSIACRWSLMDYGFINVGLLVAHDISAADDAAVRIKPGVYAFPDNLDQPITDKAALTVILEAANVPTDWLTASTTYRQLLRSMAGLFQFNQRYSGISNGQSIFGNGITLDSNYNNLSAQQKAWFVQTMESFGYLNGVQGNPKLRTLAKQAGDLWGSQPFYMGGFTF